MKSLNRQKLHGKKCLFIICLQLSRRMKKFWIGTWFLLLLVSVTLNAQTSGVLTVSTTTKTYNGQYAPKNIMAIWIEDSSGAFVKTLLAYTSNTKYRSYLSNWKSATSSTYNTVDATTGATRSSHGTRSCTWNGTNTSGTLVADGTYTVKMEMTESNATGKIGSFTFTKGSSATTVTPSSITGFSDITIKWTPSTTSVGDEQLKKNISVYPNPASDGFYVYGLDGTAVLKIFDLNGDLWLNKEVVNNQYVTISSLYQGIYLLQFDTGDEKVVRKIVKR